MLLLTVFVDLIVAVAVGCAVMSVLYVKDTAAVQLSHCSLLDSASDHGSAPLGELTSEEARLLSRSGGRLGFFMLEVQLAADTSSVVPCRYRYQDACWQHTAL